jgi:AcrR family transcriptional regulator
VGAVSTSVVPPPTRKGAATRARLLQAAKFVFERKGFLNARVSDITNRAKISYGTFYHYFDSKEAIFRELAEVEEARLTLPPPDDTLRDETPAPPAAQRIREANRRYLERYREQAAIMGVIEQVSRYDDQVNAVRVARQHHFAERAERACRRLQQEGLADAELDSVVAADALGAMVGRFAELWLVQGYRDYDFDEAVEQLSMLWANALGIRAATQPPETGAGS